MRSLGASEFHFGLIGGLPMLMVLLQFTGAFANNRVAHRKGLFVVTVIAGRLLYVPVALLPWLLPATPPERLVPWMVALITLSGALTQFPVPLWYSWMADLIPRRVLNRYWGTRQTWMHGTWTLTYLGVALFSLLCTWPASLTFPVMALIGVAAGIVDILLFVDVPEPPNTITRTTSHWRELLEPVRHPEYRVYLVFLAYRSASVMFSASFMLLYVLESLRVSVWQTTLIWCVSGIGVALSARFWGDVCDRHGNRPVLVLMAWGKPLIVLVYLLVTPANATLILPICTLFDSMLNAGMMVSSNGYMLTMAPQRNRSMFIAAVSGISGVFGGLGTIAGGKFLEAFSGFGSHFGGHEWNHFHLLFAVGFLIRLVSIPMARGVREPRSTRTLKLLNEVWGISPAQFLRFPVGLYRNVTSRRRRPPRDGADGRDA
jgi:MFS family permease